MKEPLTLHLSHPNPTYIPDIYCLAHPSHLLAHRKEVGLSFEPSTCDILLCSMDGGPPLKASGK